MSSTHLTDLPRRLLGVWPHPDDEAYLSIGLMGRLADAGHEVTVLTVTSGEKGTADPDLFATPGFARFREQELRSCLGAVGVHDLRLLGFPDGGCADIDDEVGTGAIAEVVDRVGPDAIVTFGPDGITGHPDHIAVSRWTTAAWQRVGHGELLYATMADAFLEQHEAMHDELGVFTEFGQDPVGCREEDVALAVDLDEGELDRKRRALAGHASQTAGLAELLGEDVYRTWWRRETFRRPRPAEVHDARSGDRVPALAAGTGW